MRNTLLLLLLFSTTLSAQWQPAASPPPGQGVDNFEGIAFPSPQIGYVAAYDGRIFKTSDSGQSWNLVFQAQLANLIVLEGISFYNTSVGCAYGLNLDGSYGILSTTDGGQSWHQFGYSLPLFFGRCWDADWVSPTTAYVCGEFGLVFKTTDGGLNWTTVSTAPTGDGLIVDIDFPGTNIGFVLGANGDLARTSNGGASWYYLGNWNFEAIQFFDITNGLASGPDGFYQTTDSGNHWNLIASGVPLSVFRMASDKLSGWALGEYPMRTVDGGHTWFTQNFNAPYDHFFDALCTVSPNTGWISGYYYGKYPFLISTDNGGGFGARIADWPDTISCNGAILHAEAAVIGGTPTLAEWLIDNQPIGTGLVLDWMPGNLVEGAHDLVFRTSNGNGEIRQHRTVIVPTGPTYPANSFFPGAPDLCIGQRTGIYTYLTNATDSFGLFINGQLWQGPKTVNAAQEPFAFTTPIADNALICEVKVQGPCGWYPVSSFQIGIRPLPLANFHLTTDQTLLCRTKNMVNLYVSDSEFNTLYYLYENGQFTQTRNGSSEPLLFISAAFDSTRVFKVKAHNISTECEAFLHDSLVVNVERPSAAFYVEEGVNLPNGAAIHPIFTGQEAVDFQWDFGANASPASAQQQDPGTILFDDNSVSKLRLITTAPLGCRDTVEQALGMYQPGLLPEDWVLQLPFPSQQITYPQSVIVDGNKNIYTYSQSFWPQQSYWPSKAGAASLPMAGPEASMAKYDPYGVYQWSVPFGGLWLGLFGYSFAGDNAGNIFVAQGVTPQGILNDQYWFGSTDARRYKPALNANDIILLKYNTEGRFQWQLSLGMPGENASASLTDLKTDEAGNVYVLGYQPYITPNILLFESLGDSVHTQLITQDFLAKYDNNGKLLWVADLSANGQLIWASASNITFDPQGNILISGANYTDTKPRPILAKFDPHGNLLWKTIPEDTGYSSYWFPESAICDSIGNVYLTGFWAYSLAIGPFSFLDSTFSGENQFLVAKFNPDGVPLWIKSGHSAKDATGHVLALHDGQVYLRGNLTGDMVYDSLQLTGFGYNAAFLFQLAPDDGRLLKYSYFNAIDPNNPYSFYDCDGLSLAITEDGRMHMVGGNGYQVFFGNEILTAPDTRYLMKGTPDYIYTGATETPLENDFSGSIYPNPASESAVLDFQLDKREKLNISVYDISGRKEYTLADRVFPAGAHTLHLGEALANIHPGWHWVLIRRENGRYWVMKWETV